MFLIFKRKWIIWSKPTIVGIYSELVDGWYLFISTAATSLYTTSTTVVLGVIAGPVSVGIYSSANKLLQAAQGIYSPISTSFYPRINFLMNENRDKAIEMIRYLLKIQVLITLFIGGFLFGGSF